MALFFGVGIYCYFTNPSDKEKNELLQYANNMIPSIIIYRNDALEELNKVTRKPIDLTVTKNRLKNFVIPQLILFRQKLQGLKLKTSSIRNLNKLYIESVNLRIQSLNLMIRSINGESQLDEQMVQLSNKSKSKEDEWFSQKKRSS